VGHPSPKSSAAVNAAKSSAVSKSKASVRNGPTVNSAKVSSAYFDFLRDVSVGYLSDKCLSCRHSVVTVRAKMVNGKWLPDFIERLKASA